jgi:hypothetical protein
MSSKKSTGLYSFIITMVGVAVVTVVVYYFTKSKPHYSYRRENMVAEFYDGAPHRGLQATVPTRSYNDKSHYALWVVPGVQPELSSVVRKYGGYHIKLMNMQPIDLPSNFNLNDVLTNGFPSAISHRWNLMLQQINVHEVHTKSHLAIMVIDGASTLNMLRKFFQTSKGGSWKPLHFDNSVDVDANKNVDKFNYMTLGSDDPYDQAKLDDFTYQTQWYVQLVKGPNFEWIPTQRVMLYAAQGFEG